MPTQFILFLILFLPTLLFAQGNNSWRTADRSSIGIAPQPKDEPRAMVQIYVARAYSWRGYFGVHPWISYKEKDADHYTTYQVMGFGMSRGIPVINTHQQQPDKRWFGNDPEIIFDLRGDAASAMIPHIEKAVSSYQYPKFYRLFPGPNSNTFISHVIRNTPGIYVELPPHAIGKDWIQTGHVAGLSETNTGVQVSLLGVLGFTLGLAEGVELNILGMTFGVDFLRPALKLPFVGRLGLSDKPVFGPDDIIQEEKIKSEVR